MNNEKIKNFVQFMIVWRYINSLEKEISRFDVENKN